MSPLSEKKLQRVSCNNSGRNNDDDLLTETVEKYAYNISKEQIALSPADPRDSAKLLVYNRAIGEINHDRFYNLAGHLPPRSVIVFNKTKVVPARLALQKENGHVVEILAVGWRANFLLALAPKKLKSGATLCCRKAKFIVIKKEGAHYLLRASLRTQPNKIRVFSQKDLQTILSLEGLVPLPPYLKATPLRQAELKKKYQTVFASKPGAIAAPTASLHFSSNLIEEIKKQGHKVVFITLHVGLGTFARLTGDALAQNKLHSEAFEITKQAAEIINRGKREGRPIVAVGTTVVRALESAGTKGTVAAGKSRTELFIKPGYKFKVVDQLVTNFHVPSSSLMMLVASLTGRKKLLELYQIALAKDYRFFSFGDGMLIK